MVMTTVCVTTPLSQPSPPVNNVILLPSSKKIAGRLIPRQDPPLLSPVGRCFKDIGFCHLNFRVAYVASCLASPANVTVPPTEAALTLPPGWIGPTDEQLNLGATIVYVGVGAIIGVGSLAIVCTM
jgi:hypothetical protein